MTSSGWERIPTHFDDEIEGWEGWQGAIENFAMVESYLSLCNYPDGLAKAKRTNFDCALVQCSTVVLVMVG